MKRIIGKALDYGIRGTTEASITAKLFVKRRSLDNDGFYWKIPDIGRRFKPCDGFIMLEGGKAYAIEIKVIRKKKWEYDEAKFQEEFVSLMEPLQMLTFHKLTKLGFDCIMSAYILETGKFYNVIYKHDG